MREFIESEALFRRVELGSAVLLLIFTLVALIWFPWKTVSGVLLGGGIVIVSFRVLRWQLRRGLLKPESNLNPAGLFITYYARFLVILALVFFVLYLGLATPLSFLVGLSVVVLSIFLVGAFEFIKMKKGES